MALKGGEGLIEALAFAKSDEGLSSVLQILMNSFAEISLVLQKSLVTPTGSRNSFGDEQLSVDISAENILQEATKKCNLIRAVASEEDPILREINPTGEFIVCWDPLDGSSIVDCNWTVGTICSIWRIDNHITWKGENTLIGAKGRYQAASLMGIFGPRSTSIISINGGSPLQFLLSSSNIQNNKIWKFVDTPIIKPSNAKIFSPANLRAAQELAYYKDLIDYWMKEKYTLRYTGGLVPDMYQIFIKGGGIFCNPSSDLSPPKLRLLYEVMPIAALIEGGGGKSTDGYSSILDVPLKEMDQRISMTVGTAEEVDRFERFFRKSM